MTYSSEVAVQAFLTTAQVYLEEFYFFPIQTAYEAEDKQFKIVALSHLKNYLRKEVINRAQFDDLLLLMDEFSDPYEEFMKNVAKRNWNDIKQEMLH